MSDPDTNEMDDVDERPAFLGRIRPVAKIVFVLIILWVLVGVGQGLWEVITDLRDASQAPEPRHCILEFAAFEQKPPARTQTRVAAQKRQIGSESEARW